jgi:hypothetical protein
MRDLAPDASSLLRSGRTVFRPSASDRQRVLVSLMARLGDVDIPGLIVNFVMGTGR